jgi:hypothetical protein
VITGIGDVKTIMYRICIVVLLTVLLIAANSMAMMVRDRITEVAVMRALGFTRVHVVALLLTEESDWPARLSVPGQRCGSSTAGPRSARSPEEWATWRWRRIRRHWQFSLRLG